ncbi:MAG: class I SAM-dependent methyltransferase [Thermodesulfobacteriota bacterium]
MHDGKFQNIEQRIAFVKEKEEQGTYSKISNYFELAWQAGRGYEREEDQYQRCRKLLHKEIYKFICVGGLNDRVVNKPFGYPGDYLTIYYYFLEYSGEQTYNILINQYSRSIPVAVAHRNRINRLMTEFKAISKPGGTIMSVGCGPAIEIQRASCESNFKNNNFLLFDVKKEAINFVRQKLPHPPENVKLFSSSLLGLLKSLKGQDFRDDGKDLIYCFGLYDYLEDRLAGIMLKALYDNLNPGGKLIVTNVSSTVPDRGYFEFFAQWDLILRTHTEMLSLAQKYTPEAHTWVEYDLETGTNIYLYLEKHCPPTLEDLIISNQIVQMCNIEPLNNIRPFIRAGYLLSSGFSP